MDLPVDAAGCLDVRERLLRSMRRAAIPRYCAAEIADAKRALTMIGRSNGPMREHCALSHRRRDEPFREAWTSLNGAAAARSQFEDPPPTRIKNDRTARTARAQYALSHFAKYVSYRFASSAKASRQDGALPPATTLRHHDLFAARITSKVTCRLTAP